MRKFKVGNQVEVMRGTKDSYGSWFPAKIVSVDGCKYTVRLVLFPNVEGGLAVETVPKKDIRPSPPPISTRQRWVDGDITEVYDAHSWRVGKVAKVLPNNRFVIRLFGSIQLKEFHYSSLRIHQAWHNEQWVVIGKDGRNKSIDQKYIPFCSQNSNDLQCESQGGTRKGAYIKQTYGSSPLDAFSSVGIVNRNLGSHCKSSSDDSFIASRKKRKATLEIGRCQLATGRHPGQVNHISMRSQATEENPECSVASCSSNNISENNVHNSRKSSGGILRSSDDDAESSCPSKPGKTHLQFSRDELSDNIHKLELIAYQATMHALYALGPLSWEQESLITNLRLSLHISNDEHLIQLRHLLAAQVL